MLRIRTVLYKEEKKVERFTPKNLMTVMKYQATKITGKKLFIAIRATAVET